MRRTAICVALVAVALCLVATGTQRDTVKVYFTVGQASVTDGASQIWRCNRDGSEPELVHSAPDYIGGVAVNSPAQVLYYMEFACIFTAGLDGSNPTPLDAVGWGPQATSQGAYGPVDETLGYVCWVSYSEHIHTVLGDGRDHQLFNVTDIPGMVPNPVIVDVALYVETGSTVENTTWGRVKAAFR